MMSREPHFPHTNNPLNRYDRLRSVLLSPPKHEALNFRVLTAILAWAACQSSSGTMRHSGTSTLFQSSTGLCLLTFRPVSGLRTLTVRFHTCTPRYRSFRSSSRMDDGHHAWIERVLGGCGAGTPVSFSVLAI